MATLIDNPKRARQLARAIASDLTLYHEPKLLDGIANHTLFKWIVVDKPAGMVVHPAAGHASGTLVNALLYHCKDLSGIGGVARPGIVHRLDKDTSGLVVATKHDRAHAALAAAFAAKSAGEPTTI